MSEEGESEISEEEIWEKLLGKKLIISLYNWINGEASIGVLRIWKRPEEWEVLRITKKELILQTFLVASYPFTNDCASSYLHPFVIDPEIGIVIEFLESSICSLIEVAD